MASSKIPLSVRVPSSIHRKLQTLSESTGKSLSDLSVEALASYLGEDTPTVGDRLTNLEREVAALRGKLQALATA